MPDTRWYSSEWSWIAEGLKCPRPECSGRIRVTKFLSENSFLFGMTFRCVPRSSGGCGRAIPLRMHIDVNNIPSTSKVQTELNDPPRFGDVRIFDGEQQRASDFTRAVAAIHNLPPPEEVDRRIAELSAQGLSGDALLEAARKMADEDEAAGR